jgi:hypothetical protein
MGTPPAAGQPGLPARRDTLAYKQKLQAELGDFFGQYWRTLSAFLTGRMTKKAFDEAVGPILGFRLSESELESARRVVDRPLPLFYMYLIDLGRVSIAVIANLYQERLTTTSLWQFITMPNDTLPHRL